MSIIYRKLEADVPRHYEPNAHWLVEYYAGSLYHPLGIACVTAFDSGVAWIDRILFADGFGHAPITAALERACVEQWPEIASITPGRGSSLHTLTTDSASQNLSRNFSSASVSPETEGGDSAA